MKSVPVMVASLSAILAMPAALADHRYDDDRYERGAVEYARVVSVRPIYRPVEVRAPRDECWDEPVAYEQQYDPYAGNRAAGTVIGAVAGGVAGHQFGGGRGRDAATVIGAIVGATLGHAIASEHSPPPVSRERVGYEQRCRVVEDRRYENRVEGYDVTYRYHGRLYDTRMPYDPGDRIPVQVDVRPVAY